jgi:PBP1b-binding outer membrane lipoprotein LpoB
MKKILVVLITLILIAGCAFGCAPKSDKKVIGFYADNVVHRNLLLTSQSMVNFR